MERLIVVIVAVCALANASSKLQRRVGQLHVFMSPAAAAIKDGERRSAGDDSETCGEHFANTGSR